MKVSEITEEGFYTDIVTNDNILYDDVLTVKLINNELVANWTKVDNVSYPFNDADKFLVSEATLGFNSDVFKMNKREILLYA